MHCPCCGNYVPAQYLYHNGKLYLPDGKSFYVYKRVAELFLKLLKTDIKILSKSQRVSKHERSEANVLHVTVSELRKFLLEIDLPFEIKHDRNAHVYSLREVPLVKNNNTPEHPQNVHS